MKHIRDERGEVRLNKVEKRALEILAEMDAQTESGVIRSLIRKAAKEHGAWNLAREEVAQMLRTFDDYADAD